MKNIVITGANRGIGLELTKQFAPENHVYALCRSEFPESDLNEHIEVVKIDITDETAIKKFCEKINTEKIAIDLLINNAGINGADDSGAVNVNAESVTEVVATNMVGPMMLAIHLSKAMKRADRPVMIAISSRMGTHKMINKYNAEWWPYGSSKAALSFAVSAFAINEPDIISISVHPGWVVTRMGDEGADISTADSARGIKKLYETIDVLGTGNMYMYTYDGKLMDW